MRPHRVRLTHSLVENYNLNQRMLVHRPEARSKEQIENFHCDGAPSFPLTFNRIFRSTPAIMHGYRDCASLCLQKALTSLKHGDGDNLCPASCIAQVAQVCR